MASQAVTLSRQTTKKPNGRKYSYWVLRWFGPDGKQRGKSIGSTQALSKRHAEKIRRAKEIELVTRPERRGVSRTPLLSDFVKGYVQARQTEVAAGTLALHEQTGRYLAGFFGAGRRLDQISRAEARTFKTALAGGELKHISARKRMLAIPTVELHIRNARTMFNRALDDDLILYNPFDRLACTPQPPKEWHYVPLAEFVRLVHAAPNDGWRLLLSLARLAGVCRGEALNLCWRNIDWAKSRLLIIARDDWRPKAKPRNRTVPLCRELLQMLLDAFEQADESQDRVIAPGSFVVKNASRDFSVLCARAEVERYAKPFHTLRKSCLTDWAADHPQHVVSTWAGHANVQTTSEYYLQVSESEYDRGNHRRIAGGSCTTPCTTRPKRVGIGQIGRRRRCATPCAARGVMKKRASRFELSTSSLGNR